MTRGRAAAARAARLAAPLFSVAVLAAALLQLSRLDLHAVAAMVPRGIAFWIAFAAMYAAPVVGDWLIYRRLWGMRAADMAVLARKLVGNELLLGYSGDAYLYAWARGRGRDRRGTLATVSDVAILSAAVGSALTVLIALAAAPFVMRIGLAISPWLWTASLLVVAVPPLAALAVRARSFGLAAGDIAPVTAIHAARAAATVALTALVWHLVLPQIAVTLWLVFAALRMLVARLPFVSNKDVVFAGVAAAVLGGQDHVAGLMTMMAALLVAAHVAVGVATVALGAIAHGRRVLTPVRA